MIGRDGLKFSVNWSYEMIVLPGDAKAEDLLKMHQASHDFLPLFAVDRLHHATPVLRLVQPALRIIKEDFASGSPGQDLCPTIGRIQSMQDSITSPGET